uniref:Uncharacterized protein n=1 Tax=Kalanchoe fedtschenkoi TaxID=63787 RepID=A0A7N0RAS9_KALFE
MSFSSGRPKATWQPTVTSDTTLAVYWLNWRVLLCVLWVFIAVICAFYTIWKNEGNRTGGSGGENGRMQVKESAGVLYADEAWQPCLRDMNPGWLLAFRVFGFFVLLTVLILNGVVDGASIFFYYTQWTFALVTVYFGLGSMLSMYGYIEYYGRRGNRIDGELNDSEEGSYQEQQTPSMFASKDSRFHRQQQPPARKVAGFWGYAFQIIYQMNAGAVVLTDCVFWFLIVPFLTIKNVELNFFIINMHSINAVFLLGDTALNGLRFPWFRISYFFLWTSIYVVFQWLLHACVWLWWPYPFLDLSSPFSPLWYAAVGLMHIPCFGFFALIVKWKHMLLSKWFPDSYINAGL